MTHVYDEIMRFSKPRITSQPTTALPTKTSCRQKLTLFLHNIPIKPPPPCTLPVWKGIILFTWSAIHPWFTLKTVRMYCSLSLSAFLHAHGLINPGRNLPPRRGKAFNMIKFLLRLKHIMKCAGTMRRDPRNSRNVIPSFLQ